MSELLQEVKAAVKIEDSNLLFLDISSSCTGYSIFNVNFTTKQVKAKEGGAIWFPSDSDHGEKYAYLYEALLNYFNICKQIDLLVAEQYSVNPKKAMGCLVSPELHGVVKLACAEVGWRYFGFLPQSWRSELGIKKNAEKDFKEPTKIKVLEYTTVPETIISNITKQKRTTPSDVYDAVALGMGFLKRIGFTNIDFSEIVFQGHVGIIGE